MKVEDFNFDHEYSKMIENVKKPNILICGATGVGKSSIVNELFGEIVAEVGAGAPVTKGFKEYKKDALDVVLYDSEGYEIGKEKLSNFKESVLGLIDEKNATAEMNNHIHIVWYCISAGNKRITDLDLDTIQEVMDKNVNVAVLLTQIDAVDADELAQLIEVLSLRFSLLPHFRLSINKEVPEAFLDWKALRIWTLDHLGDNLKGSFIKSLKIDLKEKRDLVNKSIVPIYAASALLIGATPLPGPDAALLVPLQVTMSMHILNAYHIDKGKNSVQVLLSSSLASSVGRLVAQTLITGIIKIIPGVGSVIGSVINGTVATSFTTTMGYAISELSYRYADAIFRGKNISLPEVFTSENITELFKLFSKQFFTKK